MGPTGVRRRVPADGLVVMCGGGDRPLRGLPPRGRGSADAGADRRERSRDGATLPRPSGPLQVRGRSGTAEPMPERRATAHQAPSLEHGPLGWKHESRLWRRSIAVLRPVCPGRRACENPRGQACEKDGVFVVCEPLGLHRSGGSPAPALGTACQHTAPRTLIRSDTDPEAPACDRPRRTWSSTRQPARTPGPGLAGVSVGRQPSPA